MFKRVHFWLQFLLLAGIIFSLVTPDVYMSCSVRG